MEKTMATKKVYLAGPIAGLTHAEATYSWRRDVYDRLHGIYRIEKGVHSMHSADPVVQIHCCSPMRAKKFLGEQTPDRVISKQAYHQHPISTGRAITGRDFDDVRTADLVFMHVLGAKEVSIGTTVELGWASALRVPIVLVMEKDGSNPHDHLFYKDLVTYHCENVEDAVMCSKALLLPGMD